MTSSGSRVGVVFPIRLEEFHARKDPGLIASALASLGHEVVFVCPEHDRIDESVLRDVELMERPDLADPALWRSLGLDVAIVYSWLGYPELLAAVRASGAAVVAKGDSDGLVSPRFHARAQLTRMRANPSPAVRLRNTGFFLQRYAWRYRTEHERFRRAFSEADVTVLETTTARDNYDAFLRRLGVGETRGGLAVVPNPVGASFLTTEIGAKKAKVLAVGRWDDPQKDPTTLRKTILRHARNTAAAEFVVVGPHALRVLSSLEAHSTVRLPGVLSPDELAREMASASCILFASRFEGSSLAGNEALAMGCTVVGPPIPSVEGAVDGGRFGTVSTSRRPRALADALQTELKHWEQGERDARAIGVEWRGRLDPLAVAGELVALAKRHSGDRDGGLAS